MRFRNCQQTKKTESGYTDLRGMYVFPCGSRVTTVSMDRLKATLKSIRFALT